MALDHDLRDQRGNDVHGNDVAILVDEPHPVRIAVVSDAKVVCPRSDFRL